MTKQHYHYLKEHRGYKYARECHVCGKTYRTNAPNKKYCSTKCSKEVQKEYARAYAKKYYSDAETKEKVRKYQKERHREERAAWDALTDEEQHEVLMQHAKKYLNKP